MKIVVILIALCMVMGGCLDPITTSGALQMAEYGSSTFSRTSLISVFGNPYDDVLIALRRTVLDVGLRPTDDRPGDGVLYLQLEDQTGETIIIRARRLGHSLTSLQISVGLLGDDAYAMAIKERFVEHLLRAHPRDRTPH